jgi:DNA (cytosine-5)-methyltransferase 1
MRIGSLFSGIGGLELGLERAGFGPVIWQVEQNPYCKRVLGKHWPEAERFDDVCAVGVSNLARVDLVCGGFPCQDVSSAGKGKGLAGDRSGLWREFARVVGELEPEWVVVENVASGVSRWFDEVVRNLEERGYGVLPVPLSAFDVGAPHKRSRMFLVAYARGIGREAMQSEMANPDGMRELQSDGGVRDERRRLGNSGGSPRGWWATEPGVGRVADGIPDRSHRLRALGNAVVPQCAEVIGWMIRELAESGRTSHQKDHPVASPTTGQPIPLHRQESHPV